jgi:hypothetical protein
MAHKIIDLFENKNPAYPLSYRKLHDLVSTFGGDGSSSEKRTERGKFFSNGYEVFIYAAVLGMTKDYRLTTDGVEKSRYNVNIQKWVHHDMSHFLLMSVIAKSNLDLFSLENMEEKDLENAITQLIHLLEEYAHGGFNIMQAAITENPDFYEEVDFFLMLLSK